MSARTSGPLEAVGVPVTVLRYYENRGATERTAAETVECLVRLLERERLDLRVPRDGRREREELVPVRAREVRDGADDPLAPERLVRERRDVAHVDPRTHDRP